MFFDKDNLSFRILDVVSLKQENVSMLNTGRNFDAISFRYSSDAVLDDGAVHQTGDGEVCFVPARVTYTRRATHDEWITVHLNLTGYVSTGIEHFTSSDPARMGEMFRKVYTVWNQKAAGYRYECAALVNEILLICYREHCRTKSEPSLIDPSLSYLNEHLADPDLSVSALAACSFVSEVYFRKLFRAKFGISPQKYIIRQRIRRAMDLMTTGYYTLTEISTLSGYTDYAYFCSEFKRLCGVCPTEYLHHIEADSSILLKD